MRKTRFSFRQSAMRYKLNTVIIALAACLSLTACGERKISADEQSQCIDAIKSGGMGGM